ncbi:MAG: FGGY family carbohydrate kinase [Spirochaetes bacterium]|nr:FGGY family carbohydrate kinase [Spirochaetota bacterium]
MEYALAVFDVGMTNKKIVIYDERLVQVDAVYRVFATLPAKPEDDGDPVEAHDLAAIEAWLLESLAVFASRYPIRAIAVTTHGATLVCVGDDGMPCAPSILYTHEPGEEFHERFYRLAGDPVELQAETGTPAFKALINPSKGLLFLRERFPAAFARTSIVLNYPQYWGWRLTGVAGAEATYVGCHSYLWDFRAKRLSAVARRLGVEALLPAGLRESWDLLGHLKPEIAQRLGLDPGVAVAMGIHDSNASLLPYLAKRGDRDFILDSTGTWCVLMHPQREYGFRSDELGKVVFFNLAATGAPVKTAIFTGGLEFEAWAGLIGATAAAAGEGRGIPAFDPAVYRLVVSERRLFILPELVRGSGQFPGSLPRAVEEGRDFGFEEIRAGNRAPAFMRDPATAFAVLNLSLAIQTETALSRIGRVPGTEIFIEGGFRKNPDYDALVATLSPGCPVGLTGFSEATSLGAAMTAKAVLTGMRLEGLAADIEMEISAVAPVDLPGLAAYRDEFLRLAAEHAWKGRNP